MIEALSDVAVRHCWICGRDTLHEDTHTCLDAKSYECTVCGTREVVSEGVPYGRVDAPKMSGRLPTRIISGGQTGADRGGLDAAIALGIPHGGWCPRGRLAEDGPIPSRYDLAETEGGGYSERTRRNVLEADATLIVTRGPLEGGSLLTATIARRAGKPCLHVNVGRLNIEWLGLGDALRAWLGEHHVATLNVAGSRESKAPGIQYDVARLLEVALSADPSAPAS